jgi:3-oxoacyl-[acyl-carrier protein] reductase
MILTPGTYVITGAAGGIGRAVAVALADRDIDLMLTDRDCKALTAAAAELAGLKAKIRTLELDVTDSAAVAALARSLADGSPVRGLVNAAGILQLGKIGEVTDADWDRVLGVNLRGTFLLCRELMPLLEQAGQSAVVNIASVSGRTKSIYSSPSYVASKGGIIGLTMTLAAQHAARGVRVNAVAPGIIDTPMLDVYTNEQRQQACAGIPLGRMGSAAEVADVIAYLLSEQSSYVLGQTINVNGGLFMQ